MSAASSGINEAWSRVSEALLRAGGGEAVIRLAGAKDAAGADLGLTADVTQEIPVSPVGLLQSESGDLQSTELLFSARTLEALRVQSGMNSAKELLESAVSFSMDGMQWVPMSVKAVSAGGAECLLRVRVAQRESSEG